MNNIQLENSPGVAAEEMIKCVFCKKEIALDDADICIVCYLPVCGECVRVPLDKDGPDYCPECYAYDGYATIWEITWMTHGGDLVKARIDLDSDTEQDQAIAWAEEYASNNDPMFEAIVDVTLTAHAPEDGEKESIIEEISSDFNEFLSMTDLDRMIDLCPGLEKYEKEWAKRHLTLNWKFETKLEI